MIVIDSGTPQIIFLSVVPGNITKYKYPVDQAYWYFVEHNPLIYWVEIFVIKIQPNLQP